MHRRRHNLFGRGSVSIQKSIVNYRASKLCVTDFSLHAALFCSIYTAWLLPGPVLYAFNTMFFVNPCAKSFITFIYMICVVGPSLYILPFSLRARSIREHVITGRKCPITSKSFYVCSTPPDPSHIHLPFARNTEASPPS